MDATLKQEILATVKAEGLNVAEEAIANAVIMAFKVIKIVVPKVSAGLGAIINPLVDAVQPKVLALIDKIDGEDDPNR